METMHLWTEKWKNWDFGLRRHVESCKRLVIPPVVHLNAFASESERDMFCRWKMRGISTEKAKTNSPTR